MLTDVGRFRVIAAEDLANLAYPGDRSRMESDLRNLVRQGLLQTRGTSALKKESQRVLTLTRQGQRFLRRHDLVPEDQTIYSGLVKPKETDHDASLYRLYQKAASAIERDGGKVLRVQLDCELKEKLMLRSNRLRRSPSSPQAGIGRAERSFLFESLSDRQCQLHHFGRGSNASTISARNVGGAPHARTSERAVRHMRRGCWSGQGLRQWRVSSMVARAKDPAVYPGDRSTSPNASALHS